MSHCELKHEFLKFNATLPLEEASTPPASWYTRDDFLAAERQTVFADHWLFALRKNELPKKGEYCTVNVAGQSLIVVRETAGKFHVFRNVCRHKATELVQGHGCANEFVCPYHGWTYGTDGELLRAPELGGVKNFNRKEQGLVPVAFEEWGPFVFVALNEPSWKLKTSLQELKSRLDATDWQSLEFVTRRSYELQCNWKVFVDNYLDSGYHVAHLHKGLASQLGLDSYRAEIFEKYSIQTCDSGDSSAKTEANLDFPERIGKGAIYAWLYPNLMVNRYGDFMDTNLVVPLDANRTQVIFDYYYAGKPEEEFLKKSLEASDKVQQEDIAICESVQRGLNSGAYQQGRYSALREEPELHFHRLLAEDFRQVFNP